MTIFNKKAPWILLAGDLIVFVLSLWITLLIRYVETPTHASFLDHLMPFSLLFIVWTLVFFISGLYDKQSTIFKSRLPALLIQSQLVNILIAVTFFYFIPWYGITPKVTLFLYLLVSVCVITLWRSYGYFLFVPRSREKAIIVGGGKEMHELIDQVSKNKNYNIDFVAVIDVDTTGEAETLLKSASTAGASMIIVDLYNSRVQTILPKLYNLLFSRIRFISMDRMYENIFDREPLSLVKHNWFLENISTSPKLMYDALKRMMDISISFILGTASLILYPFIAVAIKVEDRGPVFISQIRTGKGDRPIRITKFRSMTVSAQDASGASKEQSVTRVGSFIRKTRIDELPQLWNVVTGNLSLIGPRPELPQFVKIYDKDIPFYGVRHVIKPGLSGWAQIYHTTPPKFEASKEDTGMKLSYDLYYVKNRSFLLDLNIALKTIKELVSRKGR